MVRKVTKTKVISLFLNDYSRRYYLREMASLLNKPHQTITPYLDRLVKEGILIKNQRGKIVEFEMNFKNKRIYDYLVIAEKDKLIEHLAKEQILSVLYEKLYDFFIDGTFVVFGSSANKIQKGSDIDLLVITKKNVSAKIKEFEEVYNKKIHKIQVTSIDKLDLSFVKEVYKKHLILNNTEDIIRFFGGLHEENKLV